MDPLFETLRSHAKRRAHRLLVIGRFREDPVASGALAADEVVTRDDLSGEESASEDLDAERGFDTILWRLPRLWDDALLLGVRDLLAERGRLWIVATAPARRPLVLALSRLRFVILDEPEVPSAGAVGGDLRLVHARRGNFEVRGYRAGDEVDILRLFAPSFHVERSLEHWRWKYLQNPWGQAMITLARDPEGDLAAHYAGYPVPFVDARSGRFDEMVAVQVGDTMTDPRFRAKGRGFSSLLGRCFRHHFASFCEERVAFNYGFNTGNIRRFNFRFIGGRLAERVGYWRRSSEPPPSTRGGLRGYRSERTSDFDSRFDRLFRAAAPFYGFLVERGERWLRWRYAACPDDPPFFTVEARRFGRLVGWGVFRRRRDQLLWVDALFHPKHLAAAAEVLRSALAEPEAEGATEIVAWFSAGPEPWIAELERLGFHREEEPNDLGLIYLGFLRPDAGDLLAEVYYTMGDGDLA